MDAETSVNAEAEAFSGRFNGVPFIYASALRFTTVCLCKRRFNIRKWQEMGRRYNPAQSHQKPPVLGLRRGEERALGGGKEARRQFTGSRGGCWDRRVVNSFVNEGVKFPSK